MRPNSGLLGSLAVGLGLALAPAPAPGQDAPAPGAPDGPTPSLLVFLVVDQLPHPLLEHFDPAFEGGFRRLRDGGLRFEAVTHDHSITETAPGHATLVSGTRPSRHGVVSNQWWTFGQNGFEAVYNVEDAGAPLAGHEELPGASPRVLERSTLPEWIQSAHPGAKVVSVSGKARGAVLLAGHSEAQVYWFEPAVGGFVTSTHYRSDEPGWISDFNDEVMPEHRHDSIWALTVPEPHRDLARADSTPGEGDGVHLTFPHTYGQARSGFPELSYWTWWSDRPALDAVTLELALRAVEEEELGRDDIVDVLAISLSQTDRVGHGYGPYSLEQLDNLVRLDRGLGTLLEALDEVVGEGRYLVSLTSDHGSLELPEARAAKGLPGGRLTREDAGALQEIVNRAAAEAHEPAARAERLAEVVPETPWIARAWSHAALTDGELPDSFAVLEQNSFYPGRMSGLLARAMVQIQMTEGTVSWVIPRGTTHGSPYHYDRHVPWILYGAGVTPGVRKDRVGATDVAPTLAGMLGVATPDDLDGSDRSGGPGEGR